MIFELSVIALCILLSISIVFTKNSFMALMYGVMLFINASIVILTLGFEFLALVNLLVYVGALAVLFLFVLMLLEIPTTELRAYARGWSTLALISVLVLLNHSYSYMNELPLITFIPAMESINSLAETLYVHYADILILNSMVLTIALLGALVLAHIQSA